MQSADNVVHLSWYEGIPSVLLESMAIGVPDAASDIAAHRNILGDSSCVLRFDRESPEALAECLNHLMRVPGIAQEMVAEARKIAEDFLPETMVQKYRHLYMSMI